MLSCALRRPAAAQLLNPFISGWGSGSVYLGDVRGRYSGGSFVENDYPDTALGASSPKTWRQTMLVRARRRPPLCVLCLPKQQLAAVQQE